MLNGGPESCARAARAFIRPLPLCGSFARMNASPSRSRANAVYARFTFASGVLFLAVAVAYFSSTQWRGFAKPPLDFSGFAIGRDFLNTWMAGRSAFAGGPAAWFDFATYNAALKEVTGRPDLLPYHWSYPPHLLLFVWPLGLLPYLPAYVLWCVVGLALCLLVARSAGVARSHAMFLAVAPAVAVNVLGGQNGFFTAALLIGGLVQLDRRPVLAGILFALLTIKPQFGLLLPVLLIMTGRWRVIAATVIATAVLVAATSLWFGPAIWPEYFAKVMPYQHQAILDAGDFGWPVSSAFVDARRVGLPPQVAWAAQAISSGAAVAIVIWAFWRRRDPMLSLALFVTATFLFTPYMLNYDMVALAVVVALLRERSDNTPADHVLALAVWTLPLSMLVLGFASVPIASLVLPAFAGRLVWRLSSRKTVPAGAGDAILAGAPLPVANMPARSAHHGNTALRPDGALLYEPREISWSPRSR